MHRIASLILVLLVALAAWLAPGDTATAKKVPDVKNTKHNLSASGPGTVKSAESQVCVFCHTPHAADSQIGAPLWNRKLGSATYTKLYQSTSIEATLSELGPTGLSKLCLSCHDGTIALGNVNVANGKFDPKIQMTSGTTDQRMPPGPFGAETGFTRNLGQDLSNDHPISFTYDSSLATADGELESPPTVSTESVPPGRVIVGKRVAGQPRPMLPLEAANPADAANPLVPGQVQCTTCHDPHLKEDVAGLPPIKFLRLNRLQEAAPDGSFSESTDQFCLACHNKGGMDWAQSAHANDGVAKQLYKRTESDRREFTVATSAQLPVWKAGCLNCHDTHTVQGARRLLREGSNNLDGTVDLSRPKRGGSSAIEETCYQCHSSSADTILESNTTVPDIKTDFTTPGNVRMPITNIDQGVSEEVHNIGTGTGTQRGKDFVEGRNLLAQRHVECTDCHNPHRVIRNRKHDGSDTALGGSDAGTHRHEPGHTNIASGVLRGSTGIEITSWENGAKFTSRPSGWTELKGTGAAPNPVTREYQVCMKCHSAYAYGSTPPMLGVTKGGTPSGSANGLTQYTDQGMEFQAPHPGVTSRSDSGAYRGLRPGCSTNLASECGTGACACKTTEVNYHNNNWRAWHPVTAPTGRRHTDRNTNTGAWKWPWRDDVGTQTMYCSDCHGSNTIANTVDPNCTSATAVDNGSTAPSPRCGDSGKAWGPHGSANPFLLKGTWTRTSGSSDAICMKCHNPFSSSAFNGGGKGNLHSYHRDKISGFACSWCHIAVPHGWKNRSFLVNLNDVGEEAGLPPGTQVRNGGGAVSVKNRGYNNPPYYNNAMLKIRSFATSGSWSEGNCGSAGSPGNGNTGRDWMRDSNESCDSPN